MTLLFDLESSPSLSDSQKARLRRRLATRINKQGVLRVVSQRHRTQAANRQAATERFVELLRAALRSRRRRRIATRPSAKARAAAARRQAPPQPDQDAAAAPSSDDG